MLIAFSVILKESCQESFKRCIVLPHRHNPIYILHEKITNALCKFEGDQGCVIVLLLVRKAVQSLPLETFVHLTVHAKLCTSCLLYHFYIQQKMQ